MPEHQNIEYKQTWRDEYLKWVCGFANAQGGKIYIGIDDNGNVTGLENYKKLLEDIPNKAVSSMGIVIDVNLRRKSNKHYLEIVVQPNKVPISYHGIYHYRSGSTKQELNGAALHDFLLKKMGISWDDLIIARATLKDIDIVAIKSFVRLGVETERLSKAAAKDDVETLLKKLDLADEDGKLRNAALLLFGKNPLKYFITATFKIGRFVTNDDLRFQDVIEGNIFEMADKVIDTLRNKYLVSPISYKGLRRIEKLEYPEPALREAIINAIVHKDYTDSTIQLSVYDNKLILWNPGKLPSDISIDSLKGKHPSRPRNKHIADVFFKSGYIESWGRGIEKILNTCKSAGLPEPVFEESCGGVQVTFFKNEITESVTAITINRKSLLQLGLNERQIKAVEYVTDNFEITNAKYREINNLKGTLSAQELADLVDKGLFEKRGKGRSIAYVLKS